MRGYPKVGHHLRIAYIPPLVGSEALLIEKNIRVCLPLRVSESEEDGMLSPAFSREKPYRFYGAMTVI